MFLTELTEQPLRGLTLLYGPAASGKTTACLQALRGRCVYVSSHRNFSLERLRAMTSEAEAIVKKLALFEPGSLDELEKAVKAAVKLSAVSDLIVVDSVATSVRAAERKLGNLALHRMLRELQQARCPVLLTSELYEPGHTFIGGDMLRIAADVIIELADGKATLKKHPELAGRVWDYEIATEGLRRPATG